MGVCRPPRAGTRWDRWATMRATMANSAATPNGASPGGASGARRRPLPARLFVHPEDEAALEQLRAIPLFSECLQAVMKLVPERLLHGLNMAQKVRLGSRQLPNIYKHLPVACAALGIPEPEFYLEMDPAPNAYTYGDKQPFVTVTSGL